MEAVADTNVLFSFFNERSEARRLSMLPGLDIHSPAFSLIEIEEHKPDILERFSLSEAQFLLIMKLLKTVVKVTGEDEYSDFLSEGMKVSPDPDDADFFALALKLKCPLWSEDKVLKKQSRVKVFSTQELRELL